MIWLGVITLPTFWVILTVAIVVLVVLLLIWEIGSAQGEIMHLRRQNRELAEQLLEEHLLNS